MALSIHVEARNLPMHDAHGVYARLSADSSVSYTCRQHSRNPAWPTNLSVPASATGKVILTLHAMHGRLEDGTLGLMALDAEELRRDAPCVREMRLPSGALVAARVETVRAPRENVHFTIAASSSRLKRRGLVAGRIPLVLVIFRAAELAHEWVPVFRGAGFAQGPMVYFDDAKLDLISACLGDSTRPLRVALYRIDHEKRFKMVGFFETSVAALQSLRESVERAGDQDAVLQELQGRFQDDTPGNVTIVRVHSVEPGIRVAVRFDIFNAAEYTSSFARPGGRRKQEKLIEGFDEEPIARSRRMDSSFSVASQAARVEVSTAYDRPPPSFRFSIVKPVHPWRALLLGT